ncbi:MFS transporter [Streptomyces sp. NPDC015184]|uniref:MFS transporter n=1 Tax=Streptomyces sp. NPDC015184 TaxID=3364946 RepID=UPI0036F537E6
MHSAPPAPSSGAVSPPPAAGQGKPGRRRQLFLLSAANSADSGEQSVISVMFPAMRAALDLPLAALGVLGATAKLVGVVFGPLWVSIAQRVPRTYVLAGCSGLWGVWTVAAGFAQNYTQLLVMSTIVAAGVAGGGPLVSGILGDLFDDKSRGRAAGFLFGSAALFTGLLGPLLGQLSRFEDGWRYGFLTVGVLQILAGLALIVFFKDPGIGAAEPQLASLDGAVRVQRTRAFDRASVRRLLRIRSFPLICAQRLLGSQFILLAFGVVFLVDVRRFSNASASLVTLPAAVSYFCGTLAGGVLADRAHRRFPRTGRIAILQTSYLMYGAVAFVATQIVWSSLAVYAVLFSLLGALQGMQPSVNRPIIMSVVPPELRSAAFALFLAIESVAWAAITVLVGHLGDSIGLQGAFLWSLVVIVLAGGLFASLLYRPYAHDLAVLRHELDCRAAHGPQPPREAQQER